MDFKLLLLFLLCVICSTESVKIGVFMSTISNSQVVFANRIAEILYKAGNEVVIIRPTINPDTQRIRSKNPEIREIRLDGLPSDEDKQIWRNFTSVQQSVIFREHSLMERDIIRLAGLYESVFQTTCQSMLDSTEFIESILRENFDIVYTHHYDLCPVGILRIAQVPKFAFLLSTPLMEGFARLAGVPQPPSVVPGIIFDMTTHMSYWERVMNVFGQGMIGIFRQLYARRLTQRFRERYGPEFPNIDELCRNMSLIFANADEFFEYPRPISHKIVYIGGVATNNPKPLIGEFAEIVKSQKPVVLVSFGSVANSEEMPKAWKDAFVEFFRNNTHIQFIWKYDGSDVDVPENVMMRKWVPQNDLLGSSRITAFVTHGGYNSLNEGVYNGVPMVFVPLFADQFRNAKLAEVRGIGRTVDKADFSSSALSEAVSRIVVDKRYRENAERIRQMIRDRPVKPEVTLVEWTRFIAKHSPDLDIPTLGFVQYYCLDIIIPFGLLFLVISSLLLRTLVRCYYWSCCEMAFKERVKLD